MKEKRVVVIGGGTGTFTVLSGLKKYPIHLSAIVSMMDSGGSNRILRDEFGLLPTSDLRQCIVALAEENGLSEDLRKLFTYRYESGIGISGMTFGNLFMAALTDIYGTQEKALNKTCELLHVMGDIFPVTFDNVHLVARYDNGKQILGEHCIDMPEEEVGKHRIVEMEVIPKANANPNAVKSIRKADLIVIGPGDLYTSTICNFAVNGISEAIQKSRAKVVYIMNLMTKFGETYNYSTKDHINDLERYIGKGQIDYCLINKSKIRSATVLKKYKEVNSTPVIDSLDPIESVKILRKDLLSKKIFTKSKSDIVSRSLIRHDSKKLAKAIMSIVDGI